MDRGSRAVVSSDRFHMDPKDRFFSVGDVGEYARQCGASGDAYWTHQCRQTYEELVGVDATGECISVFWFCGCGNLGVRPASDLEKQHLEETAVLKTAEASNGVLGVYLSLAAAATGG